MVCVVWYQKQLTELVTCRCAAMDFRGHGDTKTVNDEDLSAETMARYTVCICIEQQLPHLQILGSRILLWEEFLSDHMIMVTPVFSPRFTQLKWICYKLPTCYLSVYGRSCLGLVSVTNHSQSRIMSSTLTLMLYYYLFSYLIIIIIYWTTASKSYSKWYPFPWK